MSERRRLPRKDNRVWTEAERNAYRAWLAKPSPIWTGEIADVWGDAR